jgi:peptide/nickel transport system permease protein
MSYVIVAATVTVPAYILGEVFLSLLGMGVDSSWGNMLQQSTTTDVMSHHPWVLFVPAAAIFVTVLAFNLLGDGLRDALDPRALSGGRR